MTKGKIVIVRSGQAGVFMGKLVSIKGDTVTLTQCYRLWRWGSTEGHFVRDVTQLAIRGPAPDSPNSKVSGPSPGAHMVFGVLELSEATTLALRNAVAAAKAGHR